MKLIIISPPSFIKNEIELTNLLFKEGLKNYHLRKPNAKRSKIIDFINKIDKEYHKRIILHSHYDLANELNLKGIHFTEKTKKDIEKFKTNNYSKSASCHSFEDINLLDNRIDYTFISPIYDSISKKDYKSRFSKESIENYIKTESNIEIIALGGISLDNIENIRQLGFDGIAVLGSIWNENIITDQVSFITNFKLIKEKCQ